MVVTSEIAAATRAAEVTRVVQEVVAMEVLPEATMDPEAVMVAHRRAATDHLKVVMAAHPATALHTEDPVATGDLMMTAARDTAAEVVAMVAPHKVEATADHLKVIMVALPAMAQAHLREAMDQVHRRVVIVQDKVVMAPRQAAMALHRVTTVVAMAHHQAATTDRCRVAEDPVLQVPALPEPAMAIMATQAEAMVILTATALWAMAHPEV